MMIPSARFARLLTASFFLCGILLVQGCGGGKGTVSGKVTYQGKTVRGGTVAFIPSGATSGSTPGATPVNSPIEDDGSYTVRNLPPGPVKITVETDSFRPPMTSVPQGAGGAERKMMEESLKRMNPEATDPERAKRYVPIPPQYRDADKSGLSYEVKGGKQEHNIDLK